MADSQIVGNVESPLAQSVVDSSTTDVDATTSFTKPAEFGETETSSNSILPTQNGNILSYEAQLQKSDNSLDTKDTDSELEGLSDGVGRERERRDGAKSADPDSAAETPTSGRNSPIKTESGKPIDRKTSTKKPSFKPISLNKQFLKDSLPVSGPTSTSSLGTTLQPGKGPSSLSVSSQAVPRVAPASKLKLVRTGASSQVSRPGGPGGTGNGGLARGDQGQPVWNKNQPTPPVPAKELTDEELKKQYGIHLTSRLESDDTTNKVAKWADIDDDDDDWVPETIQWNDGMKVNTNVDEQETSGSFQSTPPEAARPNTIRPVSPSPLQPPPPPPATVVKSPAPSINKESSGKPKTLITEKVPPKSASATPVPAVRASPWAKLPPLNAVTPIPVSPPKPQPPEVSYHPSVGQESPNVREVSAEVYDRSWREKGASQSNRELYNSETGQLEPVQEGRNKPARSSRGDMPINKPAVLQRPPGPAPPLGPAEPSAAFQQHRSSTSGHYRPDEHRRRRTSSNVSGGSGSIGRRQSFSRYGAEPHTSDDFGVPPNRPTYNNPFDEGPQRGPQASGLHGTTHGPPPPRSSKDQVSPTMPVAAPVTHQASPDSSNTTQSNYPPSVPSPTVPIGPEPVEDDVKLQERVMKEARELARKRRQEEEEREEAAKKERLRLKLEALEKQAREKEEMEAAVKRKAEEERLAAEKKKEEEKRRQAAELAEREREQAREREQERDRERERERRQRQQSDQNFSRAGPSGSFVDRYVRQPPAPAQPPNGHSVSATSPTLANSHHPSSLSNSSYPHSSAPPPPHLASAGSTSMARSPTKSFANTGRGYREQPWKQGPGRFEQPQQQQRYGNWTQPAGSTPGQTHPWGAVGDRTRNAPLGEGNTTLDGRYGGFGSKADSAPGNGDRQGSNRGYQLPRASTTSNLSKQDRDDATSRWNALPRKIETDEAAERQRLRQVRIERDTEEAATGIRRPPPPQPTIVETFRKVEFDDDGIHVNRRLVDVKTKEYRPEDTSSESTSAMPTDARVAAVPGQTGVPKGPSSNKSSRYFPPFPVGNTSSPTKQHDMPSARFDPPGSPPPPMSSDHPVHGDTKESIVQLPPIYGQANTGRVSPTPRTNGYHPHKGENPKSPRMQSGISAFEAVQQKILGMTQKHSPPQQSASTPHQNHNTSGPNAKPTLNREFSSTKTPYETSPERHYKPVNVSLPNKDEKNLFVLKESILTKPDHEEFFDLLFAQDFGSTPTVKLPNVASHLYTVGKSGGSVSPALIKPTKKSNPKHLICSVELFSPFGNKDFTTPDGKRFIPVHIPGGSAKEIICRGQDARRGKKSVNKRGSHRGSGGFGTGFGRGGHTRKLADPVQ